MAFDEVQAKQRLLDDALLKKTHSYLEPKPLYESHTVAINAPNVTRNITNAPK